jgi:hypothetical protein
MNNQYKGNRYVPKFYNDGNGGCEHDKTKSYESLTIVTHAGSSYTSKQYVPQNVEITDTNFWVKTFDYDAQIELFSQDVNNFNTTVNGLQTTVNSIETTVNQNNALVQANNATIEDIQTKINNVNVVNVKDYGAKGDGTTDDSTAIQNALDYVSNHGGGLVLVPDGDYYVCNTITIPSQVTLKGLSLGSNVNNSNVQIKGNLNLSVVVIMNGGSASSQTSLQNIVITRSSGIIPIGCIGVKVESSDYSTLIDVHIKRQAKGLVINGQLACSCQRVVIFGISEVYCSITDIPQVTLIDCSFGKNGGELSITGATDLLQISGVVDTLNVIRCQFNPTVSGVSNAINFKNFSGSNGYLHFDSCHLENVITTITSDSNTLAIPRLLFTGCTVSNSVLNYFISLHSNTSITEWIISNSIINGKISLSKGGTLLLTNNRIVGLCVFDLDTANISGNIFNTGLTLNGVWDDLVFANNLFDGSGQFLTDNSTGVKSIVGNISKSGFNNYNATLGGEYLKMGSGVSFGIRKYGGTLDTSGNGSFNTGIANSHINGIMVQAFYKDGSGLMKPLTVNYVDGGLVSLTGGIANAKFKGIFMFTNESIDW